MSGVKDSDTLDLRELGRALRRGRRWLLGGAVLGAALAIALTQLLTSRYEASSTVLLRESSGSSMGGLSALAGLADLLPMSIGGGAFGESSLTTEVEILTSRAVTGEVVDSLGLQTTITSPGGFAAGDVFARALVPEDLEPRLYRFSRDGDHYLVRGWGARLRVRPGEEFELRGARLVLHPEGVPSTFWVRIEGREEAIDRVLKALETEEIGNEIVKLVYRANDPVTSALVPNLLVDKYLDRRRTVDRGVNQHRYEFLLARRDSLDHELVQAEIALREHQEASGIIDPEVLARANVERAMEIKSDIEGAEVELRALNQVLGEAHTVTDYRRLAAYPTFLRNAGINTLLEQLLELETERTLLLQRRTEQDEEVLAFTEGIDHLQRQLQVLAESYGYGLSRQLRELQAEFASYQGELDRFPAGALESLRRQREVKRLSETQIVLQAQLVQARLDAITEGGDVRQVDAAVAPREPAFPSLPIFLVIGLFGGLMVGALGALGRAYLGERLEESRDVELAIGRPAVLLQDGMPLLLAETHQARSVLVVAVGAGARAAPIARRLAATATLRGHEVALADLESAEEGTQVGSPPALIAAAGNGEETGTSVARAPASAYPVFFRDRRLEAEYRLLRGALADLEGRYSLVFVALPGIERSETVALLSAERPVVLVARAGATTRTQLRTAAEAVDRLGIGVAGVVLHNGRAEDDRST